MTDAAEVLEAMIARALDRWPQERAADLLSELSREFERFKRERGDDAWIRERP